MTNRGRRRRGVEREQGKPTYSLGPDDIYISIFCDDRSHPGKIVPMRTFIPFGVVGEGKEQSIDWIELGGRYKSRASDELLPVARRATQLLDVNSDRLTAEVAGQHPELVARTRIKLICERHSAPVLTKDLPMLNPVFSTLVRGGFEEISFSLFIKFVKHVESCELRA